jgi:hypothetical protein
VLVAWKGMAEPGSVVAMHILILNLMESFSLYVAVVLQQKKPFFINLLANQFSIMHMNKLIY